MDKACILRVASFEQSFEAVAFSYIESEQSYQSAKMKIWHAMRKVLHVG